MCHNFVFGRFGAVMTYSNSESSTLEFKRELPKNKLTLLKTVIAFSNTYGGQIIVGVEDNGNVIGIDEGLVEQICDNSIRSIYDAITPSIFPSVHTKRIGDKLVVVIDIAEGPSKPYHLSSGSTADSTYIRLGAHTMPATTEMIFQLQWQGRRKFIDEMPVFEASSDDIDTPLFEEFLNKRRQKNTEGNLTEMLFHYQILVKDRGKVFPTVGGILLFGKNPQQFFPESFIICSHFSGTSGRNATASRDSNGNLIQQYKDTIAFVVSRLNTFYNIEGTKRRNEQLEIPLEAIRETVLNAVVHRNYQIPGPSKIAIYDNRLEIFSPGNFPGPIKLDKVDIGVTYIRNTIITRVFRDYGMIEKLGSGFITLFESYAKRRLPTPLVSEGAGFVKCILPRPSVNQTTNKDRDALTPLFMIKDAISTQEVMSYLNISRSSANRLLRKMTNEGFLQKIGKGAATRYRLI